MGDSAMKAQLRYADARNARFVVIEGEDERAKGVVTLRIWIWASKNRQKLKTMQNGALSAHAQFEVKKNEVSDIFSNY